MNAPGPSATALQKQGARALIAAAGFPVTGIGIPDFVVPHPLAMTRLAGRLHDQARTQFAARPTLRARLRAMSFGEEAVP